MAAVSFIDALHTFGPSADRADQMKLYGWLIGRWTMDVVVHQHDGSKRSMHGFVSAGWVLEGRAIQDVFAVPGLFYGSTLRVYDTGLDAWHVHWTDPMNQVYVPLIGRASGNEIVNEGKEPSSLARLYGDTSTLDKETTIRWIFSDITPDSFRWRSERSVDGMRWILQREFFGRRVP
jgi:hypothetical protein